MSLVYILLLVTNEAQSSEHIRTNSSKLIYIVCIALTKKN